MLVCVQDIAYRVQTIPKLHEIAGFEKPKHPLVSVIGYSKKSWQLSDGIQKRTI